MQQADSGTIGSYLHKLGDTAKIGSVVVLDTDNEQLAKDLAMHVAAMKPEFIQETEIPKERLAKEKEILLEEAKNTQPDKPVEVLEKIIMGKTKKFAQEICLLQQPYLKDSKKTVAQILAENKATVSFMQRFEVGEGIEKEQEDFAAAVMSEANKRK